MKDLEKRLSILVGEIPEIDAESAERARDRQSSLTKPRGSLGRLEEISVALAGMQGRHLPLIERKSVVVFAADHGVARRGVSAYPPEVTGQMVANFDGGGAAINALSSACGARLVVVDVGVNRPPESEAILSRRVGGGSADISRGPAMSAAELALAIGVGIEVVETESSRGCDIIVVGEMGIGNTTIASAITAVLLGRRVEEVTGPGTGLDAVGVRRKVEIIKQAIKANRPSRDQPLEVLRKVGGLEIAAMVGAILTATRKRIPVVLDGFISTCAALIADGVSRGKVRQYLIAGHRSPEPGHSLQLEALGVSPLLELGMRLGEASGGALALQVIEASVILHRDMKTFDEARVSRSLRGDLASSWDAEENGTCVPKNRTQSVGILSRASSHRSL